MLKSSTGAESNVNFVTGVSDLDKNRPRELLEFLGSRLYESLERKRVKT